MKKIIIAACAFYAAESCAMHSVAKNVAAGLLATSPVTLSGAYYYHKTTQDQAQVIGKENEKKADSFRPFVQGAVWGAVPLLNVFGMGLIALSTPIILVQSLGDWVDHRESSLSKERKLGIPERYPGPVGFLSGLSLYATIPYALSVLKKIK